VQLGDQNFVARQQVILKLDEKAFRAEDGAVAFCGPASRIGIALTQQRRDFAPSAAGERDQPVSVIGELLRHKGCASFCGIVTGKCNQGAEIAPTVRILHQQRQMMLTPKGQLRTKDWVEAVQLCGVLEAYRCINRIVVGQRQRGHPKFDGFRDQRFGP
jgi:hypothetical protein